MGTCRGSGGSLGRSEVFYRGVEEITHLPQPCLHQNSEHGSAGWVVGLDDLGGLL